MAKKIKNIRSRLFIRFIFRFIGMYSLFLRLRVENEDPWLVHLSSGGRVLLCVWHQQFFSLIRYCRRYRSYDPTLMISRSKDGEIIAGVAELTGWHAVRASSSRAGREGLQQMVRRLRTTGFAAQILDGPRGPAGVVKNGAISMAHGADAAIVPVYVIADRAWYLNSWDRFQLPKPFSRVTIRYGEMIRFGPADTDEEFERQRKYLEDTMRPGLIGFQNGF